MTMRKSSKFFVTVMAAVLTVGSIQAVSIEKIKAAPVEETIHYVALGDSIATGYGVKDSYVDQVADYLEEKYGHENVVVRTDNLAVSAMQSEGLIRALTNPKDPRFSNYQKTLKDADIVTISIGSNDILTPFMNELAEEFSCNYMTFQPTVLGLMQKNKQEDLIYHIRQLRSSLPDNQQVLSNIQSFPGRLNQIVAKVEQLAPEAAIYVNNIYNPYMKYNLYYGSTLLLKGADIADGYVMQMNQVFDSDSEDYALVDLYDVITDESQVNASAAEYNIDPHPNQVGHDRIADAVIATMKETLLYAD